MLEIFGPPDDAKTGTGVRGGDRTGNDGEGDIGDTHTGIDMSEITFSDWFFEFNDSDSDSDTNNQMEKEKEGKERTLDQKDHAHADPRMQFVVRGCGHDKDSLTSLIGLCVLNSLAYESEQYYLAETADVMDTPVKWNIIHDASMTGMTKV